MTELFHGDFLDINTNIKFIGIEKDENLISLKIELRNTVQSIKMTVKI